MSEPSEQSRGVRGRGFEVGLAVAAAIGVIGLISGVESTQRELTRPRSPSPSNVVVREARSYSDMRVRSFHPNTDLAPTWWASIQGLPDLFAPVERTERDRDAALAARAQRRAYDGAPPVIPHAVDQLATPSCETCHGAGALIAGTLAPAMSHEPRGSCLQCHVVASDPRPGTAALSAPETTFVGFRGPRGERAWQGAPPTLPHSTWMRERCESCHGPRGQLGIRSTHPWRSSCLQCHAPSATLDQRARAPLKGTP